MRKIGLPLQASVLVLSIGLHAASPLKNLRASGIADVNGGHLYYEVYGHGPPIAFLHAGLADSRMWDGQVKYFSDRYTVIRFDTRGYGKSSPPNAPYAPAEDLYALLQFLKIDRACIVGLSVGGTEAIDMAAAHPQTVSALVVIAGSPAWMQYSDEMGRRTTKATTGGAKDKGPAPVIEGWLNDPMLAVARTQPRIEKEMRMSIGQNVPGMLGLPYMRAPNIPLPKLSDFKMPTLVMVGDHDDPEIVQRAHVISREIPGAREVVIKGADHMVNIEKPREFNRAIDGFLHSLK